MNGYRWELLSPAEGPRWPEGRIPPCSAAECWAEATWKLFFNLPGETRPGVMPFCSQHKRELEAEGVGEVQ